MSSPPSPPSLPPPGLAGTAPGTGWDGPDQPLIHQPLPLHGFTTPVKLVQDVQLKHTFNPDTAAQVALNIHTLKGALRSPGKKCDSLNKLL